MTFPFLHFSALAKIVVLCPQFLHKMLLRSENSYSRVFVSLKSSLFVTRSSGISAQPHTPAFLEVRAAAEGELSLGSGLLIVSNYLRCLIRKWYIIDEVQ